MPTLWRAFPWDEDAGDGRPFSASYLPPTSGQGRFDLPVELSPVLYAAETPEHAIAEVLQPWRNRALRDEHLLRAGRRIALTRIELDDEASSGLLDLCRVRGLRAAGVGADDVAARRRSTTQPIALTAWEGGHTGVRWWSAFWGEWHGVVLFGRRVEGRWRTDTPEPLDPRHPALRRAAAELGMRVRSRA